MIAISSDGVNGIDLGFTNRNLDPNGGIFAQRDTPLFTRGENVAFNISNATDYKLVVQGNTYRLFAGSTALLTNQPLRNYTAFDPTTTDPPLPYSPFSQPNFLFFGDETDQASSTFTLGPISVNNFPVAVNDIYNVLHDQVLFSPLSVLSNDSDGNFLDTLTPAVFIGPTKGTLLFQPDGNFNYIPNPGFVGTDTFTYILSDGAETTEGTVTINVTNNPPQAQADIYNVLHDQVLFSPLSVLSNDSDGDLFDTLTPAVFIGPTKGTLLFQPDGNFNYIPNPGFVGTDTFTYILSDGAETTEGTVTINVTNNPTQAQADIYNVLHDQVLVSPPSVLSNDSDGDMSDTLTAVVVTGPTKGSVFFQPEGKFDYFPNPGFVGTDTFTYIVSDGADTTEGTVTINVTNNPPQAQADIYSVLHDQVLFSPLSVLSNDSDGDMSDTLTPAVVTGPTKGSLFFQPDGNFNYIPNPGFVGTDTFTYILSDGAETTKGTVTINVTNNPPQAQADIYNVLHDQVLFSPLSVLSNDSDGDMLDTLTAVVVTGPTKGSVFFQPEGKFDYFPNPGFVGTDTFTYIVSDGAQSTEGTVTINVTNNPPQAQADIYSISAGKVLSETATAALANE